MSGEHRRLTTNSDFARCLIGAASDGDLILVKKLLDQNISVNYQDIYGTTALMLATRYGDLEIVRDSAD